MSIRISWICDNQHTDISIYKSIEEITIKNLPSPLATDLKNEYLDPVDDQPYYYIVSSKFNDQLYFSNQVTTESLLDGVFILDLSEKYISPTATSVNFTSMS